MPITASDFSADTGRSTTAGATRTTVASTRSEALTHAVDLARPAPSGNDTQPWLIGLENDGITVRTGRGRQLTRVDPTSRGLVQSSGAALLHLRIGLAEQGWAVAVDRSPGLRIPTCSRRFGRCRSTGQPARSVGTAGKQATHRSTWFLG